ncbi:MAG: hypothetical protein ACFFCE_19140 [Promethearchaeota archaeon]
MDDFLKKLKLSEFAREMYLKSINRFPLSFYELYSIVPKATLEEFKKSLSELLDVGLIIQQTSKDQETVAHYLALPPIFPILNYYNNINSNLDNIKNSIQELMINAVNEIFKENKTIELDSILHTFQEIRKDINEDSIIQKQEAEDIVEGMDELKVVKQNLTIFHQKIISITQSKFAELLKTINNLEVDIIEKIEAMEFKKHKDEIISVIKQQFKEKLDEIIKVFPNTLQELIEKELDDTGKPIENSSDLIIQYQNDFKMLLLNLLSKFETEMNKINDFLIENNENLFAKMKNLEIKIAQNLNSIIQDSLIEVSNLNKPIESVLKDYLQEINKTDRFQFNKIRAINSITKINESIQHLIENSKSDLIIIIPSLENHLAIEQFEKKNSELKIKIVSSEAHTNSIVKKLKNIKNITFKSHQNGDLIILKSDNNTLIIGVIQDSINPLNNFVGVETSFDPLIKLLNPIIQNIWEEAYSDTFHGTQMAKTQSGVATTTTKSSVPIKPIISKQTIGQSINIKNKQTEPTVNISNQIHKIPEVNSSSIKTQPTTTSSPTSTAPLITDLKQKLQEKIDFVSVAQPKAGDEAGVIINNAFTNLINKLDILKGDQFGKELAEIADLILEKKGFSVTLHKVRRIINRFKDKLVLLNDSDKKEIIEEIQEWKKKIF